MTPILPSLKIAYTALRTNKVRATLTMLGVIIGVAAVIATVAVGAGATKTIQQQIAGLGSNLIIVIPGSITSSGIRLGSGQALTLTESDARAIAAQCPAVAVAAPVVRQGQQVIGATITGPRLFWESRRTISPCAISPSRKALRSRGRT